MGQESS
ncbi:hypothetical protein VCHENC02_3098A, partial [Vibrio harveyi]